MTHSELNQALNYALHSLLRRPRRQLYLLRNTRHRLWIILDIENDTTVAAHYRDPASTAIATLNIQSLQHALQLSKQQHFQDYIISKSFLGFESNPLRSLQFIINDYLKNQTHHHPKAHATK